MFIVIRGKSTGSGALLMTKGKPMETLVQLCYCAKKPFSPTGWLNMGVLAEYRRVLLALLVLTLTTIGSAALFADDNAERTVALVEIDGPIGPATSDYVVRALEQAHAQGVSAIVLRIDTPGGLDTSMREIIQAVLSSPDAVIGYVAPNGARAASAGTYILYATPLAAMAPATNLGAATPVPIGGLPMPDGAAKDDGTEAKDQTPAHPTMADKAVSDAVAYIRGLAQLHGRNTEWAEQAVTRAASLSAQEALAAGVINLVASDTDSLLAQADGRTIKVKGEDHVLRIKGAKVVVFAPDLRTEFLSVITNPTFAYILLIIGIYGIVFEFWNPGFTGPGVIGGICLLIALFALHLLPVNYAGLALIGLGVAFMVAEAFMPAFGILGIGGVVAFVIGSVMLMEADVPGFEVSWPVIAVVGGASSSLFLISLVLLARSRRRPVVSGREEMIGLNGKVIEWHGQQGRVRTHGENWQAQSTTKLKPGCQVIVTDIDALVLTVQPIQEDEKE
jgi:membrane-bound serine protease (ClpP class)